MLSEMKNKISSPDFLNPLDKKCETVTVHLRRTFFRQAKDVEICKKAINEKLDEVLTQVPINIMKTFPHMYNSSEIWVATCTTHAEAQLKNKTPEEYDSLWYLLTMSNYIGEKMSYGKYPACVGVTQDTLKTGTLSRSLENPSDYLKTKVIRCCPENRKP